MEKKNFVPEGNVNIYLKTLTAGHLHILIANFFHNNLAAIFTPVGCSKATSLHCFQNILTT